MSKNGIIGLSREELESVHLLVHLLRQPDPVLAELTRQALAYLEVLETRSPPGRLAKASNSQ